MKISAHLEDWELIQPFRISGGEWITSPGPVVQLSEDGFIGRGEAQGVFYLNETADSIFAQLCDFVDIDGPLLLKYDHPLGLNYNRGVVDVFDSRFWG